MNKLVSNFLKSCRVRHGLSVQEFSFLYNVDSQAVYNFEKGKTFTGKVLIKYICMMSTDEVYELEKIVKNNRELAEGGEDYD